MDSQSLASYEALLSAVAGAATPALLVFGGTCEPGQRIAILPGSFNPPTRAHSGLALAALATGSFDRVLLALSVRTVNKEQVTGAPLAHRLAMMALQARAEPRLVALVWNRGLYVDQALLTHQVLAPSALTFVVGFDKIVQILDRRYYDDRDSALDSLFAAATFLVAPREGADQADLAALFGRPENTRYASRVRFLPLDMLTQEELTLSSTWVRNQLAAGHDVAALLPPGVASYVRDHALYARSNA